MFPEAGHKLGPYEILGELGGGGMARVYRAWDARLHREVAIKVIDDQYAMPGIGERFLREARAASALNHPNICTIFDIGEQDGAPYLVMELMEGESLKERIENNPISADEILRYAAEIADALAAAHARGIVHRDIKPANIFLVKKPTGSAQAKVLDFGLAKVERHPSENWDFGGHLTTMGATVGTVSYMSPEQARGEELDARSDLFALGIVMYEMATGTLPFKGATSALVFVQLLGLKAPDPIRKLNGEIPDDLERVIFKLLAKSPKARFQTAVELCDELHELSETRSGWLTRMKAQPLPLQPHDAALSAPNQTNRPLDRRIGDAGRLKSARDEKLRPADAPERVFPANQDVPLDNASGAKSGRTSIATNPRVTYPAVAPYMSHSGAHRTPDAAPSMGEGHGMIPSGGSADATAPFGISRDRDRARSGGRPATNTTPATASNSGTDLPATESTNRDELGFAFGGGVRWTWIALIVVLALVIAMLAARHLGLMGGTPRIRGGLLLLAQVKRFNRLSAYSRVENV